MTTTLTDKYRPRRLSQMVGQTAAINIAKGMIDKGVPPTVLLTGPRSSGKTTLARILAYRLNCQQPKEYEPCGKCPSCKARPRHPDILEINAADERGIGTIRRLQSVSVLAPRFERRVVVMDECYPGETLVMVDYDKAVPIRDVVNNSYPTVLSYDLDKKQIVRRGVTAHFSRPYHDKLVTIHFGDQSIKCTRRQEVWVVGKGMTPAEDIIPGDRVIQYDGDFSRFRICDDCGSVVHYKDFGNHRRTHNPVDRKGLTAKLRVCERCGKSYNYLEGRGSRFCSMSCYVQDPIACAVCGEPTFNEKYCSAECYHQTTVGREVTDQTRQKISQSLKRFATTPEGQRFHQKRSQQQQGKNNTIYRYMTPQEVKAHCSRVSREWRASLSEEETTKRNHIFINAPKHVRHPNRVESKIIDFNVSGLKYVGDGSLFMTFKASSAHERRCMSKLKGTDTWKKNPDFVYVPSDNVEKVVEVMDFEYWHTPEEADFVSQMYQKLGYPCLILDASRLHTDPLAVRGELEAFCNNHYGKVTDVCLSRSKCQGGLVYDIEVADTHNFFVVPGTYSYGSGPNREGICTNPGKPILSSNCHALTPQAYQAALKLFEEPPVSCSFFLVTTNPEKMPETILSRCSPIGLRTISEKVLSKWLIDVAKREDFDLDGKAAQALAEASSGHPREALTFLQQVMSHPEIGAEDFPLGLLGVVRQVTRTASGKLIIDFVTAAVKGEPSQCFRAYEHIDDPVVFLTGVVEALQALVRLLIDPRLVSSRFATQLKPLRKAKLDEATLCLEAFAEALQQAKTYVMPPDVVLDLAILKATA